MKKNKYQFIKFQYKNNKLKRPTFKYQQEQLKPKHDTAAIQPHM